MDVYEEKLKRFIETNGITAEHLSFEQSCHSVAEAAEADSLLTMKALPELFVTPTTGRMSRNIMIKISVELVEEARRKAVL